MEQQIQLDRAAAPKLEAQGKGPPGVKTILLHVQNDRALDQTLETALSLARACGAHLSCLHITPIEAYSAFDAMGGTERDVDGGASGY